MEEIFTIDVPYKNTQKSFTGQLVLQGYSHKIKILVEKTELFFEPDEEGNYRLIKMPWQEQNELEKIDRELISEIQQTIHEILR